jgi:hypothetical protein
MPTSRPLMPPSDCEDRAVDGVDVDAHLQRRFAVLRRRAHGIAEFGEAQEGEQQRRRTDADAGDQQVKRADRAAANRDAPVWKIVGQGPRIWRKDELHDLVEHEADADRRKQWRDARRALQRAQADALDRHPDERAGDEHDCHRHRQRRVQKRDRRPADIGADRIDRAMGEIDEIGDAENQRKSDSEQSVDIADDEAVDGIVDKGTQAVVSSMSKAKATGRGQGRLRSSPRQNSLFVQLALGFLPSHRTNWPFLTTR